MAEKCRLAQDTSGHLMRFQRDPKLDSIYCGVGSFFLRYFCLISTRYPSIRCVKRDLQFWHCFLILSTYLHPNRRTRRVHLEDMSSVEEYGTRKFSTHRTHQGPRTCTQLRLQAGWRRIHLLPSFHCYNLRERGKILLSQGLKREALGCALK